MDEAIKQSLETYVTNRMEFKIGFEFQNVARWNLTTLERLLMDRAVYTGLDPDDPGASASLYATMIFDLFVYIEGTLNNGLRRILPFNRNLHPELRKLLKRATTQNLAPFDLLRWIDAAFNTNFVETTLSKHCEAFKYHEAFRNLVAHGLPVTARGFVDMDSLTFDRNVIPAEKTFSDFIDFMKKNKIYQESDAGPAHITTLATKEIYLFFKLNISNFVSTLVSSANSELITSILLTFDYELFKLACPLKTPKT